MRTRQRSIGDNGVVPAALPLGDPMPLDGCLPPDALARLGQRGFSVYLHVPFCRVRCGYCDFNTYTATELGGANGDPVIGPGTYADSVLAELDLADGVLSEAPQAPTVDTLFIGGGTPTLVSGDDLDRMITAVGRAWGFSANAEITVEANPDTVTPALADTLARAGVTRVSIGMQSADPAVLATLDRTHDPANVSQAVAAVRAAGMQVSLDLIYGTPGESVASWEDSLRAALVLEPDHISAYALIVEDGTNLAAQVRRGEVPAPVDDDQATKYESADDLLSAAGYGWYEVSNWALREDAQCRHNLAYWRSADWWGLGPGAHSHVGGVRWWNVKHPAAYAGRLARRETPGAARELLDPEQILDERVLLESRIREGLSVQVLKDAGMSQDEVRSRVAGLIADSLIDAAAALQGRVVLTRRGRLLADTVVHRLL